MIINVLALLITIVSVIVTRKETKKDKQPWYIYPVAYIVIFFILKGTLTTVWFIVSTPIKFIINLF